MSMVSIRAAVPSDLAAIRTLLQECNLPFEDLQADHLGDFLVLTDGAVIGSVGLERFGHEALLRSLALNATQRNGGWGRRLVQAIETHAAASEIASLYLLTTTAASFFEAGGFRRIDRAAAPASMQSTTEFALLCPASAICLFKSVAPST